MKNPTVRRVVSRFAERVAEGPLDLDDYGTLVNQPERAAALFARLIGDAILETLTMNTEPNPAPTVALPFAAVRLAMEMGARALRDDDRANTAAVAELGVRLAELGARALEILGDPLTAMAPGITTTPRDTLYMQNIRRAARSLGLLGEERPDRPCDPSCARRTHPAAACDCTRAQESARG